MAPMRKVDRLEFEYRKRNRPKSRKNSKQHQTILHERLSVLYNGHSDRRLQEREG